MKPFGAFDFPQRPRDNFNNRSSFNESLLRNTTKNPLKMGCGCLVLGLAATLAIYAGLGSLGWAGIRKYINYEDKYYSALSMADKDKNGNLDASETTAFFNETRSLRLPSQSWEDVRPSYSSLVKYLDSDKDY